MLCTDKLREERGGNPALFCGVHVGYVIITNSTGLVVLRGYSIRKVLG